jgi:hypothetical protein
MSQNQSSNTVVPIDHIRATIDGDAVVLQQFRETDPEVLALAKASNDIPGSVHRMLQVGARAINGAQTTVDVEIVDRSFADLTTRFDGTLKEAREEIAETLEQSLDSEDGEVRKTLDAFRADFDKKLGDTFDPDSKKSVLGLVNAMLDDTHRMHVESLRRILDPTDDEGPLGRYRADILKAVRTESEQVRKVVTSLSEKIAVRAAENDLMDKTAIKGASFEDIVHAHTSAIAASHGDLPEQTGRTPGVSGNLKGDEVVTLNPDDTNGRGGHYVLEIKDRKLGQAAILAELDDALANREAHAAIAVFSRQQHSPTAVPFVYNGNRAIVVLDKDDPDPAALTLAIMWARWTVRRALCDAPVDDINIEHIEQIIDEASRALDRVTTIRRCHSIAIKKIGEATDQGNCLHAEIQDSLARVRDELR